MGNFEENIPNSIATLEKELGQKRRDIWAIESEFVHECNCEYCTEQSDELPDDQQNIVDEIYGNIEDILATIDKLKRHAIVHNIPVKIDES